MFLLFGRTVGFDFINYDDPAYVTQNAALADGVTLDGFKWAATETGETNLWHPMTWVSHMVDIEVFGVEQAGGHHLVNVFWHALAAVGLFLLLKRIFGSAKMALVAALIWAFHPQRVQSVVWVSERKDVLSGAFLLWSWLVWEEGRERAKARAWQWLAVLLFLLAAMAKPSVVPLPLILLLRELLRGDLKWEGRSLRKIAFQVAPFFAVSLAVVTLTLWFQQKGGLADVSQTMPLSRRLMLMPGVLWWYPQTFVWPFPQRLWVYPQEGRLTEWLFPVVGFSAVLVLTWFARRERLVLLGAGVFLLLWLPVSGLVAVSFYNVADRYAYLPHLGLVIYLVGVWKWLVKRTRESVAGFAPVVASVLFVVLAGSTWKQTSYWKNSETLFSRERAINPRSLLAPIQLAVALEQKGKLKESLGLYHEALGIDNESGLAATNAGRIYLKMGQEGEAIHMFRQAIEKKTLNSEQPYLLLCKLLVDGGSASEATAVLEKGMVRFPAKTTLPMERGALAQSVLRDPREAMMWFERVLKLEPLHPDALQGKGVALLEVGEVEEGRRTLRKLLKHHPEREAIRRFLEKR
ncbi:MAG: tetratricopeptide repeat protein [Roseibacillus sp.]